MAFLKKAFRWGSRVLMAGFAVTLAVAGFGWFWERSEQKALFELALEAPGEIIRVGGQDLHVIVEGVGSPGVLLISGLGDDFRGWGEIRGRLADSVRVVSYDRPGLGWSPPRESALTVDAAVQDVLGLLSDSGLFESPPILVGHSLGGVIARQLAYESPSQISGLVLLDPAVPDAMPYLMNAIGGIFYRLGSWSGRVGLSRWQFYRANPHLTREQQLRTGHLNASGAWARETLREFQGALNSESVVPSQDGLGTLPLTLIAAPAFAPPGFAGAAAELDAAKRLVARESERGRFVEVTTGHYIHRENPDTVTAEVFRMLGAIRGKVDTEAGQGPAG